MSLAAVEQISFDLNITDITQIKSTLRANPDLGAGRLYEVGDELTLTNVKIRCAKVTVEGAPLTATMSFELVEFAIEE